MEELNVTPATPATPVVPVIPVQAASPTPTSTAPVPAVIPLTAEEYRKMLDDQNELSRYKADQARRDAEVAAKELEAARKSGDADKYIEHINRSTEQTLAQAKAQQDAAVSAARQEARAAKEAAEREVATRDAHLRTIEGRAQRYALDGELSRAIAANPNLVPNASGQLTELFRPHLAAVAEGETYAVRTAGGQTAAEFVAAQLSRPEYAHFLRANNPQGGTGGVQPHMQSAPNVPGAPDAPVVPKNMGEAMILQMKSMQKTQGDSQTNMSQPMGLKATR